jgi:hypothetical protein
MLRIIVEDFKARLRELQSRCEALLTRKRGEAVEERLAGRDGILERATAARRLPGVVMAFQPFRSSGGPLAKGMKKITHSGHRFPPEIPFLLFLSFCREKKIGGAIRDTPFGSGMRLVTARAGGNATTRVCPYYVCNIRQHSRT